MSYFKVTFDDGSTLRLSLKGKGLIADKKVRSIIGRNDIRYKSPCLNKVVVVSQLRNLFSNPASILKEELTKDGYRVDEKICERFIEYAVKRL